MCRPAWVSARPGFWLANGITKNIFFNGSGATQRVMITVCAVSGGDVNLELQGSALYNGISVPECVTVTESIASGNLARIGNGSGQNASGTYSLAILP